MLGFMPYNRTARIYHQNNNNLNEWGLATEELTYEGNCYITYNTDISSTVGVTGMETITSATIIFRGFVDVEVGDYIEYEVAKGKFKKSMLIDVYYSEDMAGEIISTRVVVANGKRN